MQSKIVGIMLFVLQNLYCIVNINLWIIVIILGVILYKFGMSNQLQCTCTELDIKDPFVIREYL